MQPPANRRHETLLTHREWVRVLARSLTSRAADADDVEQQTWLAALTAAPDDARSLRAWLVTVARNAARKLHRTDVRQRARAERSAVHTPTRSAADLAEEADTHARVIAAVVALDEPYREAVLLRYFEGLGVHAVAARAGVPLETARARLRRARALLRDRLDAEFGPERPWRLAVLALSGDGTDAVRPGGTVPGALAEGALVGTKTIVAASAVLVAAGLVVWGTSRRAAGPDAATAPAAESVAPAQAAETANRSRPRARADDTAVAPAPAPASIPPDAAKAVPLDIRARLAEKLDSRDPLLEMLDARADAGDAVFGRIADAIDCPVVLTKAAEAKLAAAAGAQGFTLSGRMPGERALLLATSIHGLTFVVADERIVVLVQKEELTAATELVVPARPERHAPVVLRGTVRDERGVVVPDAEITTYTGVFRAVCTSGADGTWEFRRRGLGVGQNAYVVARAPGREPSLAVKVDETSGRDPIALTLRGAAGRIVVRVTLDGVAVEAAGVSVGPASPLASRSIDGRATWELPWSSTTGADGVCAFDGVAPGSTTLRVSKQGLAPATQEATVAAGETAEVTIRLTTRPSLAAKVAEARVSARFEDTDVQSVVSYLSRVAGVNLLVFPDLATAAADRRISITLDQEPLESALRTLCDQIGDATFEVRESENLVVLRRRSTGK